MDSHARRPLGDTLLLLAALGTLCMGIVQAAMPFSRWLLHAFGGPEAWSAPLLFASSFAVAALLVLVALYPLSASGRIRRLPFLRVVLILVGVVLVCRGLALPEQIAGALGHGAFAETWSWGGILTCAGTLTVGLGYLVGLALSWPHTARPRTARAVDA